MVNWLVSNVIQSKSLAWKDGKERERGWIFEFVSSEIKKKPVEHWWFMSHSWDFGVLPVFHKACTHLADNILFGSWQKLPFRFANRGTLKKIFPSSRENLEIHENFLIDIFFQDVACNWKIWLTFHPRQKYFPFPEAICLRLLILSLEKAYQNLGRKIMVLGPLISRYCWQIFSQYNQNTGPYIVNYPV